MAQPLRVALDATPLSVPYGGLHRYTSELAGALALRYPADVYHLMSDQPFHVAEAPRNLVCHLPTTAAINRRWWTAGLPRELHRLDIDVFHGTDFAVPYLPIRPSVMTVHDCSPWRDESRQGTSHRVRRRTPILLRLGIATMIITPSEAILREVVDRFGVLRNRIVAIPLAAAPHFRPVEPVKAANPYFLYVGAVNARKNIGIIEEAARELGVQLRMPARDGRVREADLPGLYSGAVAVLYPSLYEGFGLPVLEAMQCGAAVIASKDPALMELSAGAVVHVEADNPAKWLHAMRRALAGEGRDEMRRQALARAAEFSWERTAMLTREVYDEARRLF